MIRLTIRLPDDLHASLDAAAREDRRTLNSEMLWLLARALEAREAEGTAGGRQLMEAAGGIPEFTLPPEIEAIIEEGRAHPELSVPRLPPRRTPRAT